MTEADRLLGIELCKHFPVDLADAQGIINFVRASVQSSGAGTDLDRRVGELRLKYKADPNDTLEEWIGRLVSASAEKVYTKADCEAMCQLAIEAYKRSQLKLHPPVPPNHHPRG